MPCQLVLDTVACAHLIFIYFKTIWIISSPAGGGSCSFGTGEGVRRVQCPPRPATWGWEPGAKVGPFGVGWGGDPLPTAAQPLQGGLTSVTSTTWGSAGAVPAWPLSAGRAGWKNLY